MNDDDNPPSKLLVRTLKYFEPHEKFELEFNFHLIDLKKKKLELNYIPAIPLMKEGVLGKMAAMLESESDSCIYIVGGVLNPTKLNQNKAKYEEQKEEDDDMNHFHCNSSKYSFVSERWDAFDLPIQTNGGYIPDTIFGKLYFFRFPWRRPMVYENGLKELELPDHLIHRKVSFPVISDRKNNRYLFHFYDSCEIYAFHPNSTATATAAGDWTCVVDHFNRDWKTTVAVSGNILFFHVCTLYYIFTAYDMSTNKWLEIVEDFTRVGACVSHFSHMFTLPEKHDVLCLASWRCTTPEVVDILRLRFNHTIGSNQLTLTALDYQFYEIPITSTGCDFPSALGTYLSCFYF